MKLLIEDVKRNLLSLQKHLRANRPQIITEALELFNLGLDRDDVYQELRERYIDAIPVVAEGADDAVDLDDLIGGPLGVALEAIDGRVVESLLWLFIGAADRRRQRLAVQHKGGRSLGSLGELMNRRRRALAGASMVDRPASTHIDAAAGGATGATDATDDVTASRGSTIGWELNEGGL